MTTITSMVHCEDPRFIDDSALEVTVVDGRGGRESVYLVGLDAETSQAVIRGAPRWPGDTHYPRTEWYVDDVLPRAVTRGRNTSYVLDVFDALESLFAERECAECAGLGHVDVGDHRRWDPGIERMEACDDCKGAGRVPA